MARAFDAVLVIAFGGPQGRDDVRPFLANVLRGRRVAPERVEEVAHHYELFDGVSPLTELTTRQSLLLLEAAARSRARAAGLRRDAQLASVPRGHAGDDGAPRRAARGRLHRRGAPELFELHAVSRERRGRAGEPSPLAGLEDVEIVYVGDWHSHPGFIEANADHVRDALTRLPEAVRDRARLIFTAHSIPVSMARAVSVSAPAGGDGAGRRGSRRDERLGARVSEPQRPARGSLARARRLRLPAPGGGARAAAAVLCPIGFICDHIEVLYDLDTEAAGVCRDLGLPMARASAVNDHPRFVDAMADAVVRDDRAIRRRGGRCRSSAVGGNVSKVLKF